MKEVQEADTNISVTSNAVFTLTDEEFCWHKEVRPMGQSFLKQVTFASNMVACPLYVSCFSIALELSPLAEPAPRLYSSNISSDK